MKGRPFGSAPGFRISNFSPAGSRRIMSLLTSSSHLMIIPVLHTQMSCGLGPCSGSDACPLPPLMLWFARFTISSKMVPSLLNAEIHPRLPLLSLTMKGRPVGSVPGFRISSFSPAGSRRIISLLTSSSHLITTPSLHLQMSCGLGPNSDNFGSKA